MSESYGYAYLTSYGWTGSGTGLRNGAIDKPLTIPPKKNLSGLGKDRDEAFPFWDQSVCSFIPPCASNLPSSTQLVRRRVKGDQDKSIER